MQYLSFPILPISYLTLSMHWHISLQICLELYRKAMEGMRRHMLTRIHLVEEQEPMWVISEVRARKAKSQITPPGSFDPDFVLTKMPLLEHLTCFVPGLLTLGERAEGRGGESSIIRTITSR